MHLVCDEADRVFDIISSQIKGSRIVFVEYDYDEKEEFFIFQNILNTKTSLKDRFSPREIKKLKAVMKKINYLSILLNMLLHFWFIFI